jgi:polyisoprenoid-binding protein YceI
MMMRWRWRWLCVFPVLVLPPVAAAQQVLLDKSEIRFAGKQMNVPAEGRFKKFTVDLKLDLKQLDASRAQLVIDVNSVDLGGPELETEIKRRPWFDAATHPQVKFVSTAVKSLGGDRYQMTGKLTIKGVTKDISAPFVLKAEAGGLTSAQGSFGLKRLDYRIGDGVWADIETVADEVTIQFKFLLSGLVR